MGRKCRNLRIRWKLLGDLNAGTLSSISDVNCQSQGHLNAVESSCGEVSKRPRLVVLGAYPNACHRPRGKNELVGSYDSLKLPFLSVCGTPFW